MCLAVQVVQPFIPSVAVSRLASNDAPAITYSDLRFELLLALVLPYLHLSTFGWILRQTTRLGNNFRLGLFLVRQNPVCRQEAQELPIRSLTCQL